jgi:hypothetical protein
MVEDQEHAKLGLVSIASDRSERKRKGGKSKAKFLEKCQQKNGEPLVLYFLYGARHRVRMMKID